jgi:hypothetical protein
MAPFREHSKKPEEVARRIERLYPGPYLELFARGEARPNWTVWGNEARGGAEISEPRPDPGDMPPIPDFLRRPLPQERAPSEGRR